MAGSFGDDFFVEAMGRARSPLNEFMQMAAPGYAKPDFGSFGSSGQGLTAKVPGMDQMPGFGLTSSPSFPNPENEFMGAIGLWQKSQGEIATATAQKKAREAAQAQQKPAPSGSVVTPSSGDAPLAPGTGNPQVASQIVNTATARYGPGAGPVIAALLKVEAGLTGNVGDSGNSFGPFQFHRAYRLAEYARDNGLTLDQAGEMARTQPLHAAQWALSPQGYLGRALQEGVTSGKNGRALLDHVLLVQNGNALNIPEFYNAYHSAWLQAAQQAEIQQSRPQVSPTVAAATGASATAQRILAQADQWIAANPRYNMVSGATNRREADCSGFIVGLMNELGTPFRGGVRTAEQIRQASIPIASGDIRPGDVVFFHSTYDGAPPANQASHVGIVQQNGIMIHTGGTAPLGPASYETPHWRNKFLDVRRLPQVAGSYAAPLPRATGATE